MANTENPFAELMKTFRQFAEMGWPGGEMPDMAKAGSEQFQSMQEIARISSEALQKMITRQQEMAAEAMGAWQKAAQQSVSSDPANMMGRITDMSRENAERAAKNFAELSQLAADAQKKIMRAAGGTGKKA